MGALSGPLGVMRTLKLKVVLTEQQKGSLLRTMETYTRAFEIAARWGYQNRNAKKFDVYRGVYYAIRQEVPSLPAALAISAKDVACEALRTVELRKIPKRRTFAAMRYPWKESRIHIPKRIDKPGLSGRSYKDYLLLPARLPAIHTMEGPGRDRHV
jgi:predicted transposase